MSEAGPVRLDAGSFLIVMTGEAERRRRSGDQLDARDVFVYADLMAAQTARGHGGVNGLAFGFVLVALQAFCRIGVLVQRNGMNCGAGARGKQSEKTDANHEGSNDPFACGLSGRFRKPNAMRKQDHSDTEESAVRQSIRNVREQ